MRVLWITNILLPEAVALLTNTSECKGSGGWLMSSAKSLVESKVVSLSIVSVSSKVKHFTKFKGKEIEYYILPICKRVDDYEKLMKIVHNYVKPDLVHIHGTEWPYGLAYMNSCGSDNVVISMQGILGVIAKCYTDGLSCWQIISNITLRDIRLKTIFGEKNDYKKRSIFEELAIKKVKYVIGRTSFDREYVMSINQELKYFFCNESLRDEFYSSKWEYMKCIPHSIFLSQANYPIKGLHQILRAIPIVRNRYPDVKVYIAGTDITRHKNLSDRMKYSGYGKIIFKLIRKYGLHDIVKFTGLLSAHDMVKELLKSNLYVCPSSCENSSNSIAEAQLLGVPCLATNRGGNPDMIPNEKCGYLYDYNDIEGLADVVCNIFESSAYFDNSYVRNMAKKRHDKSANLNITLNIYKTIISR